jgi:hypothetical protein
MRCILVAAAALILCGCGYVGDPLPPALNIPQATTDLSAVQRAGEIRIGFTAPALTTEELAIREFGDVELRIGPVPSEFSFERWAESAQRIDVPAADPGKPVSVTSPAAPFAGKEVLIAVRFTHPRGRHSEWSNRVLLRPRAPLPKPRLIPEPRADGIRLRSEPMVSGATLRVERNGEPMQHPDGSDVLDKQVAPGKTYAYRGRLVLDGAESEISDPLTVTYQDRFVPDPPQKLNAVAGVDGVALAWDPSPDAATYRIYRAGAEGEFGLIATDVVTPVFTDKSALSSGRYRVTAVDAAGNESAPSSTVEVQR